MNLLNETLPETPSTDNAPDSATPTAPDNTDSPSWWIDEKTPGHGMRPDFLPEKYKTVADVVKAHKELEQRLGTAPAEYDFSKGDGWMEPDYEPFLDMAEYAKSKHVPQDVMDKMLESVGLYLDEFKPDLAAEKSKLGDNASQRLQVLNNWAKSNLSEKSFGALAGAMRSAEAIEALEELRTLMMSQTSIVPSANGASAGASMTYDEFRSELRENYKKYKTDPAYRAKMQSKREAIMARQK